MLRASDKLRVKPGPRPASSQFLHGCAQLLQRAAAFVERPNAEFEPPALAPLPGAAFDRATAQALANAQQNESVAMLLVSIDYFDVLTASHGANVAQELLSIVADRITATVRLTDEMAPHDDGFFVLWAPSADAPDIGEIAHRIATQFNQPLVTSAGQLPITVSIGMTSVSGSRRNDTTPRMLKRQARSAVVSAQRSGRAQLAVFDQAIQEQAVASYKTERQLHAALRNDRLAVHYQPIVSLHSGETVGIEALARWNDDVLGSISPSTFIPIAEEAGLIGELGRLVLRTAVGQSRQWDHDGQASPLISVNLSNRQLLDPTLIPAVDLLLTESSMDPRQLCFEISESVVMSDVAASMTILGHMKDLGLRLAIDNFGTGYSSLSYLRRLPVDMLKIDQSFVQSIYNRDDRVIIKAIIDLAHTLGMTTVAEGVETRLQVEVLHALNCDMAQGFYLHAPTAANEVDFSRIDFEASDPNDLALSGQSAASRRMATPSSGNLDFSSASATTTGRYVRQ